MVEQLGQGYTVGFPFEEQTILFSLQSWEKVEFLFYVAYKVALYKIHIICGFYAIETLALTQALQTLL